MGFPPGLHAVSLEEVCAHFGKTLRDNVSPRYCKMS